MSSYTPWVVWEFLNRLNLMASALSSIKWGRRWLLSVTILFSRFGICIIYIIYYLYISNQGSETSKVGIRHWHFNAWCVLAQTSNIPNIPLSSASQIRSSFHLTSLSQWNQSDPHHSQEKGVSTQSFSGDLSMNSLHFFSPHGLLFWFSVLKRGGKTPRSIQIRSKRQTGKVASPATD